MRYHLGVEEMEPHHWVAYVCELPGCFSHAQTYEAVVTQAPTAIAAHLNWLLGNGANTKLVTEPIEVEVAEVFRSFNSEGDYIVNAFFADDGRPLRDYDAQAGLWLLENMRRDLLELLQPLSDEQFRKSLAESSDQSIESILDHMGWAEWWYLDRLDLAFPRDEMPIEPLTKLRHVRAQFMDALPKFVGDARVVERVGEQWSPRKILRRALWHERDHTQQIARLVNG